MSSPFELRFSCLNLAKEIQENHSIWSQNQAQLAGLPYTQPSADTLTNSIIGTAHQLSLFINGDFDKLGLPDTYTISQLSGDKASPNNLAADRAHSRIKAMLGEFKPDPSVRIKEFLSRAMPEEPKLNLLALESFPFLGIEGHVVVDEIYQPKSLLKYAEYKNSAQGKNVIYVCDSLAAISELEREIVKSDTSESGIKFTVMSNLKDIKTDPAADLIIFDNCYNYNDTTFVLPTHRYKQVIVYRGAHCNPKLSTDDYFAQFMVNATMKLIGDKR